MKFLKYIFLIIFIFSLSSLSFLLAQEKIKDASISATDKQIEELKEKIATKVAQLQEKQNNKATAGFITEIDNNNFKIITTDNENFLIKLDEVITKYYQINNDKISEIDKSQIQKDDYIIIDGLINDKEINANLIYKDESYQIFKGKIIEINKDEYYLKVLTEGKEEFILDIELATKKLMLNIKNFQLEKIGFSKIKEGDNIHFIIKQTSLKKESRFSAKKIIIIPQEFFLLLSE